MSGRVKPVANWLCRAIEATSSANIRWIRLIIRIQISHVWVLVYCLRVITWLVNVGILVYEIVCNCMIKCSSTLAYIFCLLYVMCVWFSLLRWSLIYWWMQMWELLVVIRVMDTLLLSFGLDFVVQVSFRVVAHVFIYLLGNYFLILLILVLHFVLASWCAYF